MTEIKRIEMDLQRVSTRIKAINRWWEEQAPITDEMIRDIRAYLAYSEVDDVCLS